MENLNKKELNCYVDLNLGIDVRFLNSRQYPNGWKSHWHDAMEIVYVDSGSISVKINELTNQINAQKNQLVIIPPKSLHEIAANSNGFSIISIFFDLPSLTNQTFFSSLFLNDTLDKKISFPFLSDSAEIIKNVLSLSSSFGKHNPVYVQGLAYQLLGLLIEKSNYNNAISKSNRSKDILEYIQNHYSENLKIKEICEKFGYTESYFCRLFKSLTNVNFSTYLQIIRIEEAKRLLQETELDIKTVSEKIGFSDFSYFCKCFKKHLKITPSQYKTESKNKIMAQR